MNKLKLCVLLAALFSHTAYADFKDGNKLHSELSDTGPVSRSIAMGYITGIADAYGGTNHCPPGNVTAGQLNDMVKNYLDNTPSIRHLPASIIVSHVLKSVWPCKKGNGV